MSKQEEKEWWTGRGVQKPKPLDLIGCRRLKIPYSRLSGVLRVHRMSRKCSGSFGRSAVMIGGRSTIMVESPEARVEIPEN
jgi:hypothetical protein